MDKYKIDILKDTNNEIFEQLCDLITKFAIHVFMVQKFDLMNKRNNNSEEYITNYKKYLNESDLEYLQKDIDARIEFFKNSIKNQDDNKVTRHYLLLKNNKVIGFQTAQIRKNIDPNIFEGWRNFAYIKKEYMGKVECVVNYYNQEEKKIMSDVVYDDITKWFIENNVSIEKTATGKNMYKNILLYIVYKGFDIDYCDDKRIYLKKDVLNVKEKDERIKIYKDYIKSMA